MQLTKPFRLFILAVGEWVMVLPACAFLTAAAFRLLQPRQYEPAHTSWIIFAWATAHISRLGAAMLFVGLPCIVAVAGCAALRRVWREDQNVARRRDARSDDLTATSSARSADHSDAGGCSHPDVCYRSCFHRLSKNGRSDFLPLSCLPDEQAIAIGVIHSNFALWHVIRISNRRDFHTAHHQMCSQGNQIGRVKVEQYRLLAGNDRFGCAREH